MSGNSLVLKALGSLRAITETKPFAAFTEFHNSLRGYRQQGLVYDDLIPDEEPIVRKALSRLPPRVLEQRQFRFRRALNLSMKKISLPESEWIKPSEDVRYLELVLRQVEAEDITRFNYDNLAAIPKELLARNRSS